MLLPFDESQETSNVEADRPKRTPLNPNRIRDHLANERTYLSWMRSGIALMGFGVLIVRMRMLNMPAASHVPGNGWKLGLAFSIVGLLAVLLSTQHYFAVRNDIEQDTYEPPDRWVILSSLVVLLPCWRIPSTRTAGTMSSPSVAKAWPTRSAPSPFSLKTTSWPASIRPNCLPRTNSSPPLPSPWIARTHPPT